MDANKCNAKLVKPAWCVLGNLCEVSLCLLLPLMTVWSHYRCTATAPPKLQGAAHPGGCQECRERQSMCWLLWSRTTDSPLSGTCLFFCWRWGGSLPLVESRTGINGSLTTPAPFSSLSEWEADSCVVLFTFFFLYKQCWQSAHVTCLAAVSSVSSRANGSAKLGSQIISKTSERGDFWDGTNQK